MDERGELCLRCLAHGEHVPATVCCIWLCADHWSWAVLNQIVKPSQFLHEQHTSEVRETRLP